MRYENLRSKYIVLNSDFWKSASSWLCKIFLRKSDWKNGTDYIYGIRTKTWVLCLIFFVFSRQTYWVITYYMFHFHAKVKHYTFISFVRADYPQVSINCNHYKFVFFLYVLFPFFCPGIRQFLMCARVYVCAYRFVTLRTTRTHTCVEVVNILIYSILYKRKEIHIYTLLIISYL